MKLELKKITRGLRFRLTLSYALFFTLLLAAVGTLFRQYLETTLDHTIRDTLEQEWVAIKGFLQIRNGEAEWFYDPRDPDETFIVSRLQRVYLLADAEGRALQSSQIYSSFGDYKPEETREAVRRHESTWRVRKSSQGIDYLLRGGVMYSNDGKRIPYYVATGRSLADNQRVVREFTRGFLTWMPVMIFGVCLVGWLVAGRALRPVTDVAQAAQRISGSNLTPRIQPRGSGDELDYLVETFNNMVERLEASFNQIRQFSTDVSHELRTPITAIRGQLEVALFTAKDADQYREAILDSLQDIERLSQIVRALLLLSQAESGQVTLHKAPIDLTAAAREIIDHFQIPADEKQIRLVADLPPKCPAEVDRVQWERMISNLISNAIKFTPPGGQVRFSLVPRSDRIDVIVEDTGRGIAPEHLPHIFDRFYQAPGSNKSDVERGLGLGLSFVNWIAKAHGGWINVQSTLDKGSRFTVSLPAPSDRITGPMSLQGSGTPATV